MAEINERVATLEQAQKTICKDIKEIKNTLLGRPSWAVTIIIAFLTTLSCSSIIYIVTS